MKIRYSQHASLRIIERSIPKALIKEALRNGKRQDLEFGKAKCIYKKHKMLTVIYKVEIDCINIITAYYEN